MGSCSCGHFMSLIMGDYVAGFLGLSEGNAWNMNAFDVSVKETSRPEFAGGLLLWISTAYQNKGGQSRRKRPR